MEAFVFLLDLLFNLLITKFFFSKEIDLFLAEVKALDSAR